MRKLLNKNRDYNRI